MLRSLLVASLRYRVAVVAAAAALLLAGTWRALRTPLDVFPEFAPPLVEVQVEAPGLSSEAVEEQVTLLLESALNGVPRMTTIRSKSVQGLSSVVLLFERGTDLFQARQIVSERVAVVRLPQAARTPVVMPILSSTSRVLKIGLTPKIGPNGQPLCTQTDVSVLMRWVIEPKLLAVPGVANVSTYGLLDKQYQVLVDPAQLRANDVTLDQVKAAARQAVAYGSAGYHDTPNQRLAVYYGTRVRTPEDLAKAVVAYRPAANGTGPATPILLGQVATLTTGNPPSVGDGVVNDQPGLLAVVEKYPWANTLEVTEGVEHALKVLEPGLPNVAVTTKIFRPATFIELALANLRFAMLLGCGLVALIVVAFLFEWRTAVISLTAIPLSIVGAVAVLSELGGTLNTMVLAGLAIAVGEVVDDAIIDVENIVRRLRLNREAGSPRSPFAVVLDASLEVRSAVVFATFIVGFVCLPIFFMGGVAGAFFRPLALAYLLAVLTSLVVALTVTPAMALLLLPGAADRAHHVPPLARATRAFYRRLLPFALNRPVLPYALLALLAVGAGVLYPRLKEEYLPRFQETDFLMHWVAKPGTNIDVVRNDIVTVSKEMRQETPVAEFGSHIARAAAHGEEVVGPNFSELWISLKPDYGNYDDARKQIEGVMARHPGFEYDLLTYLQERIKEVLSGTGAAIVLRIYGPDLAVLRDKAQAVRAAIEGTDGSGRGKVPGVIDLKVEPQVLVPQLRLEFRLDELAAHGLTPAAVADAVTTLLNGTKVGEVHLEQQSFDLVVWGHPNIRGNVNALNDLPIDLPPGRGGASGGTVPLSKVAKIERVEALNTIRHDKASRCIDVSCNLSGSDLTGVVREIEERLRPLHQEGYRIEVLGEYQARQENQRQLLGVSVLAFLGIAMLLYIDFRSLRLMKMVLFTLPFALIGGVAAAWLAGGVLSLGSLVGFITVLGIAGRNGIMLVSHYQHLRLQEGVPFGRELIVRGAEERVAPILMTALAAGLGLLPLALSGSKPGYEVEYPMAVVILGGLATSTLLNLLVLPVLYEQFGKKALPEEEGVEQPALPAKAAPDGVAGAGPVHATGEEQTTLAAKLT
jgi:CzcA family heavy metal efflux pump